MLGKQINRQAFKLIFDNPLLTADLFPHKAALDLAIATHRKVVEELAEVAKTKNSKAFWSKIKASGNTDTQLKVTYLVYIYLREFEPDGCKWFRKEIIAGKNVNNF
ncbi:MAG: hypothetical protein N4J56_002501 [Chroococcidiopsis sp. SAG 2025]|uniref:hypothetical protein n=1 Tax=Chroococcidiopsis sp. SAG 2025 TaxID=171389 RepID=UPI0029374200|nr:hypothetical protein [Chroococcidiopsis sp. SAG 2025]MDV2992847.1 hypothetical protein [Chroococcidiopsis sp. SAG 2025]